MNGIQCKPQANTVHGAMEPANTVNAPGLLVPIARGQ